VNASGEIYTSNSYKYIYIYIYIYILQIIRIWVTKASELLTDVYTPKFHFIYLFQKSINILCINYNRFPTTGSVYIAEIVCDTKSHKEGPFNAVSDSISGFVCGHNLELAEIHFWD